MNSNPSILIVEDDEDLGNILAEYLRIKGFDIQLTRSAEEAQGLLSESWQLLILDVSLPGISGFELAEKLRKKGSRLPFIFLTARGQKKDKLLGLSLGADDYITKPFEVEELLLRIRNILRRSGQVESKVLHFHDLQLDCDNLQLTIGKETMDLTEKESALLALFVEHKDKLLKRDFILNEVWGDDDYFNGRSMDVFISRIRKYLSHSQHLTLTNVRGVGFKMNAE